MFHKDLDDGDIHLVYTWEYADATARLAASGFAASDIGKLAKQQSDSTLWMLTDDSPITWVALGSPYAYAWTYADAATRAAASGFVASDVGKLARQLDNNTLWMLTATTPTWLAVGGSAAWGGITGSIGAQADLVAALATKMTLITANTTLYLATTGNDVTGDGSVGNPWLTLAKVIDYIKDKFVIQGVMLTIQLGDGSFTTPTTVWERIDGDRITIQGTNVYNVTLSSIQSGSKIGNYMRIVCNMSTVANIAVGDGVIIRSTSGGTNPELMRCMAVVQNVDVGNTRITLDIPTKSALLPSGAVTYATVKIIKTKINLVNTTLIAMNGGILTLKNLFVQSTSAQYALMAMNFGKINFGTSSTQGVINFTGSGIYCDTGGSFYGGNDYNGIAANTRCLYIEAGSYAATRYCVFNGAAQGIYANNGGVAYPYFASIIGCSTGVLSDYGSLINLGLGSLLSRNVNYGGAAQHGSKLVSATLTVSYNGTGLYASNGSYIATSPVTFTGNTTNSNPVVLTLGNVQSFIEW